MSYFSKLVKQLFPEPEVATSKEPLVSEALIRSMNEKGRYFKWLNQSTYKSVLYEIYENYQLKKQQLTKNWWVHVLSSKYANGFAITFNQLYTTHDFQHLFDYFKDQVLNIGYRLCVSDRKIYDRPNYVETVEKYYLKPPARKSYESSGLLDQVYGNIIIEHVLIDDKPSYIRFMANIYSDRLYTKALDFEELMKVIFLKEKGGGK
ncbi:hypothetical protein R9C00_14670 [Flammeovirgaceae bacterium SG7u.111]|nr:hypothetical protein [Flammeovirgaceae bacterium SG7u.132]WPO38702.1 hypothetical protein R9C00_14670 [Flammeovirgaceae bacterium SG7u.111]